MVMVISCNNLTGLKKVDFLIVRSKAFDLHLWLSWQESETLCGDISLNFDNIAHVASKQEQSHVGFNVSQ